MKAYHIPKDDELIHIETDMKESTLKKKPDSNGVAVSITFDVWKAKSSGLFKMDTEVSLDGVVSLKKSQVEKSSKGVDDEKKRIQLMFTGRSRHAV